MNSVIQLVSYISLVFFQRTFLIRVPTLLCCFQQFLPRVLSYTPFSKFLSRSFIEHFSRVSSPQFLFILVPSVMIWFLPIELLPRECIRESFQTSSFRSSFTGLMIWLRAGLFEPYFFAFLFYFRHRFVLS